ncbi:glycosyl hydrolase family 28-related protein [Geodermatophilus tzadiensis]|uniref:glycosyl hydrolase family 28-related protein n=1 Tax=Geodermatophilus tzadiensis TaxID=1137988 RepID=UPI0014742BC0|nr:right-handed parallel beta-helix repeat-containing protein [Geodermatophilus tzadiensis]
MTLSVTGGDTGARRWTPMDFGAAGDGRTDDTSALQRALDALRPGDTLVLPEGRTFLHSDVLTIRVPTTRLAGGGSLVAVEEARSAVVVDADDVIVDGVTLEMRSTSRRWDAFEQMKLRVAGHSGVVVRRVTIDGSAAAGIYVGTGASGFRVEDVRVRDTRADGLHVTGGAHDGVVQGVVASETGDDGVAVVSYLGDGVPVRRVRIEDVTVRDNTWGRGVSVVGGEDITVVDGLVERSSAAGLYVASEGAPYDTFAPRRVDVSGFRVVAGNTDPSVGHGAVLVYGGRPDRPPSDVAISGLMVRATRDGAPWEVGVVAEPGASVRDVTFTDVTVAGPGPAFVAAGVDPDCCPRIGWVVDGSAVPDAP